MLRKLPFNSPRTLPAAFSRLSHVISVSLSHNYFEGSARKHGNKEEETLTSSRSSTSSQRGLVHAQDS
eukprot:6422348-Amphidinium_carterae.1